MSYSTRENSITTCKGFTVEACGYIVGQHSSWSNFIKQADLLANVSKCIIIINKSKYNKFSQSSIVTHLRVQAARDRGHG
jgi:hypothetical protein